MNNEEEKEPTPEPKGKSILWPMLLWPLVGVPVFWGAFFGLMWLFPMGDDSHGIGKMLKAWVLAGVSCFAIGAWLGVRSKTFRYPAMSFIVFGLLGAMLGMAYAFGSSMAVFG